MALTRQWRQAVKELMATCAPQGYVTFDELSRRLAGIETDPQALDAVLAMLEARRIEVVDSPPSSTLPREAAVPERPAEERAVPDILAAYQRDLAKVRPLDEEAQRVIGMQLQEALDALREALRSRPESAHADGCTPRMLEDAPKDDVAWLYEQVMAWERMAEAGMAHAVPSGVRELRLVIDDARARLVDGTMRLVVYLARHYQNRGVEFLDLVQEGNAGLLRAAQRFDPRRGQSFASYATWWIRRALAQAVREQGKAFKVPPSLDSALRRLNKERRRQTQEMGREPSAEELAAALQLDGAEIDQLLRLGTAPVRLDAPAGDDADGTLGGVLDIGATDEFSPEHAMLRAEVARVLQTLDPAEQMVVRLRFGMADGTARSLEEVAALLRMTRERARQIEERALRKLRHPSRRNRLDMLD